MQNYAKAEVQILQTLKTMHKIRKGGCTNLINIQAMHKLRKGEGTKHINMQTNA